MVQGLASITHRERVQLWMEERELGTEKGGILNDDTIEEDMNNILTRIVKNSFSKGLRNRLKGPTLIVTTVARIPAWESAARTKNSALKVIEHRSRSRTSDPAKLLEAHLVITSYETVTSEYKTHTEGWARKQALFGIKWLRVVVDEAEKIQNSVLKRSLACFKLESDYRWCLTREPLQETMEALWSLLYFLDNNIFADWDDSSSNPSRTRQRLLQNTLKRFMQHSENAEPLEDALSETVEATVLSVSNTPSWDSRSTDQAAETVVMSSPLRRNTVSPDLVLGSRPPLRDLLPPAVQTPTTVPTNVQSSGRHQLGEGSRTALRYNGGGATIISENLSGAVHFAGCRSPLIKKDIITPKLPACSGPTNSPTARPILGLPSTHIFCSPLPGPSGSVPITDIQRVAGGGFGDIFRGRRGTQDVALKCPKQTHDHRNANRWLSREMEIMRGITHPNILPLLGEHVMDGKRYAIFPWCANGNVLLYMKSCPNLDRLRVVVQVARALCHLHTRFPVVIHGDIKPDNVLIGNDGNVLLSDFGLSKYEATARFASPLNRTDSGLRSAGTYRFMAPELCDHIDDGQTPEPSKTTMSDV